MSTDAPTISGLHKLAIARGFPRAECHDILHDMAVFAFGVNSMTDLDDRQRAHLADCIRMHNGRPSQPRASARADRPPSQSRGVQPARRSRRGQPARDGVTRMITPAQRDLINTLCSEMGWSRSLLNRYLDTHFGKRSLFEVATSAEAMRVIQMLKSYKARQQRTRRPPAWRDWHDEPRRHGDAERTAERV